MNLVTFDWILSSFIQKAHTLTNYFFNGGNGQLIGALRSHMDAVMELANTVSGYGRVPDGSKPWTELMLTNQSCSSKLYVVRHCHESQI